MQSALVAQLVLHAAAPQTKGAQATVGGVRQLPEPSHLPTKLAVPAAQIAAPQLVALVGAVQATGLLPSQLVGPQVGSPLFGAQLPCPARGAPATALQVPTLPASLHDWHWPPQLEPQQTPSKQLLEVHCAAAVQACPFASVQLPGCEPLHVPLGQLEAPQQTPSTQVSPDLHCALAVHGVPCVSRTTQAPTLQK